MDFTGIIICFVVMIMAMFYWTLIVYLALLLGCMFIDIMIDGIKRLLK